MCRGLLFSCLVGLLMFACFLFTVRLKSNAAKLSQAVAYEFFSVCFRCLSSGYELNLPHCPSPVFQFHSAKNIEHDTNHGAGLDQQSRPAKHLPAERQSPERIHPSACRNTLFVRRPASVTQRGSVFIAFLSVASCQRAEVFSEETRCLVFVQGEECHGSGKSTMLHEKLPGGVCSKWLFFNRQ